MERSECTTSTIIKRVEADAKGLVLECATLVEPSSSRTESPPAFRMSIKLSAKMMHSINFVGTVIIIVKRKQNRAQCALRADALHQRKSPLPIASDQQQSNET